MSIIVWQFEHSLSLPFFGIGMKTDLFQSCGHCWVFQICQHIECNTFIASSFRIWNSSTGMPSPPLALFIVMLPKAYLTLHSRMSDSRWVITPLWLSGSLRYFLYSSVYSCHNNTIFLLQTHTLWIMMRELHIHTLTYTHTHTHTFSHTYPLLTNTAKTAICQILTYL